MDLESFVQKAEALDVSKIINDAIKQHEKAIVKLNTDQQLFNKGIGDDNIKLRPSYADSTTRYKKRRGQPTDRVTLRDTGRFHKGWRIIYEADQITITSDPIVVGRSFELVGHLINRYGKNIMGLSPENIIKVQNLIMPTIVAKLKEIVLK